MKYLKMVLFGEAAEQDNASPTKMNTSAGNTIYANDASTPTSHLASRKVKIEMALASAFSHEPLSTQTSDRAVCASVSNQSTHHLCHINEIPAPQAPDASSIASAMRLQLPAYDSQLLDEYERNSEVNVVTYNDFTKSALPSDKSKSVPTDYDVVFGDAIFKPCYKFKNWNGSRLNWLNDLEQRQDMRRQQYALQSQQASGINTKTKQQQANQSNHYDQPSGFKSSQSRRTIFQGSIRHNSDWEYSAHVPGLVRVQTKTEHAKTSQWRQCERSQHYIRQTTTETLANVKQNLKSRKKCLDVRPLEVLDEQSTISLHFLCFRCKNVIFQYLNKFGVL